MLTPLIICAFPLHSCLPMLFLLFDCHLRYWRQDTRVQFLWNLLIGCTMSHSQISFNINWIGCPSPIYHPVDVGGDRPAPSLGATGGISRASACRVPPPHLPHAHHRFYSISAFSVPLNIIGPFREQLLRVDGWRILPGVLLFGNALTVILCWL